MDTHPSPISPYLTVSDAAAAIAFYKAVFDAVENSRLMAEDGKRVMHCQLSLNGGTIMLADAFPDFGGPHAPLGEERPPVGIALDLASPAAVDEVAAKAGRHGATLIMGPKDEFWGARFCVLRDPFGHRWMLNGALPAGSGG
jgi:PhnB protein